MFMFNTVLHRKDFFRIAVIVCRDVGFSLAALVAAIDESDL